MPATGELAIAIPHKEIAAFCASRASNVCPSKFEVVGVA
jgi:hypothetical protein